MWLTAAGWQSRLGRIQVTVTDWRAVGGMLQGSSGPIVAQFASAKLVGAVDLGQFKLGNRWSTLAQERFLMKAGCSQLAAFLFIVACCNTADAQVRGVRYGSAEHMQLLQRQRRQAPTVEGEKVGLREITEGEVEPGTEGIPYYGEAVFVEDEKNTSTFSVLQVIDDGNLLVDAFGRTWWFEMPTAGIADDTKIDVSKMVFRFIGTKRYESALGPKTVFHLKYVRPFVAAEAKSAESISEPRTWTDRSGKHSTEATFVGFEDGKVILKRVDGTIVRVSPTSLSAKDVKWYRDELKRRKKEE